MNFFEKIIQLSSTSARWRSYGVLALVLLVTPLAAEDAAPKPLDLLLQTLNRVENPDAQANTKSSRKVRMKRFGAWPRRSA
jgi:hypothetical protein